MVKENLNRNDTIEKEKLVFVDIILKNISWFILLGFLIVLSISTKNFLSINNLINILTQTTVLGLLVLGESVVLLSGYFDLTPEGTMIFSLIVGIWLMAGTNPLRSHLDLPPVVCIAISLLIGILIGFLQSYLILYVRMNDFMTSLATYITLTGASLLWLKGGTIYPLAESYRSLGYKTVGLIPISVIVMIILYIIFQYILVKTPFGVSVYAVGGNPHAARATGINNKKVIMICFMISGFLAALAGWVLAGRLNSASGQLSTGIIFNVMAAAVVGGISLKGGSGSVIGAFSGALLLVVITNAMTLNNVNPYWVNVVRGFVILFAIFIDAVRSRRININR